MDRNFSWYISMVEVNTELAPGHFKNGGGIMTTLAFFEAVSDTINGKYYWNRYW